jgi:hypothetical protein
MSETQDIQQETHLHEFGSGAPSTASDPALEALTTLSAVAARGAHDLNAVNNDLLAMQRHRRQGWSWRQIMAASAGPASPLSSMSHIVGDLRHASAEFRRALARALRVEQMRISDIGGLLQVSRQRVTALLRPTRDPEE